MKKRYLAFLLIILICVMSIFQVNAIETNKNVYIIPIEGEIGPALDQYVNDTMTNIKEDPNAVGIIFEINTYGGRIDSANNISKAMMDIDIPTISFVNTKAVSAGVLLAISSDTIIMAPGSTIGSAETIPNTEKILSEWTSSLRTVAQKKGHSAKIVAAMADKSIEIAGLIEKDKLLNLTAQEAKEVGFIDSIESSYNNILQNMDLEYTDIIKVPISGTVKLAQIATSTYISTILLALGFIGIIVEILTPGFGIGGTISLMAFGIYFGGAILAGNTTWAVLLVFLVGIILLFIETFIPGFGIPGIGGIISIIISIFMASDNAATAIISLLIAFICTIIAFILLLKYAPRNKYFDSIILKTQIKGDEEEKTNEKEKYLNKEGIAISMLRPVGKIDIDGDILEVISEGVFIEKGSRVVVTNINDNKIIVKKID
ncbi:MAG: nodulation protein NfeD [Clostridiales bacterium]|nr:nodulation protein NfeD [Clostridiales bacterium]